MNCTDYVIKARFHTAYDINKFSLIEKSHINIRDRQKCISYIAISINTVFQKDVNEQERTPHEGSLSCKFLKC